MTFSNSFRQGQTPLCCQICETDKIDWKCKVCLNLMCNNCKKIYPLIWKGHEVIKIKDIGKEPVDFKVIKEHTVDIKNIHQLDVCGDGSLWIGDGKSKTIQHIEIEHDEVRTLSTYKTPVYGLATSPLGSTYIVNKACILGTINSRAGEITDSMFKIVQQWKLNCVHVTRDHSVIVGACDSKYNGIVIVMNREGEQIKKYEHDKQQRIFKLPVKITTTNRGNIVVCDRYANKVVVLHPGGRIGYYHGHPDKNSPDKPMKPYGVVTTPSDNILVYDFETKNLYILNNEGGFITYYDPKDIGIMRPYSLALTPAGDIYLGCVSGEKAAEGTKAKLYKITFSGF